MRKQGYYEELYNSMLLLPEWKDRMEAAARKIFEGFNAYMDVSHATGFPWQVVGILHWRECDCDFKGCLHNGQPWNQVTTAAPKGVGPFHSWHDAAVDAIGKTYRIPQTTEEIGLFFERYNGLGYWYRGVNSPYLWRGTQHCKGVGKFVERKGSSTYLPWMESKDQDEGAMPLLKILRGGN